MAAVRWKHLPGRGSGRMRDSDARRLRRATEAVGSAFPSASLDGNVLTLRFEGARLATLNTLLGAGHWPQRAYAKAWHQAVALAVYRLRVRPRFERARILVVRYTPSHPADPDNLVAKALVDGIRKAGVLPDDTPEVVQEVAVRQAQGDPAVMARVTGTSSDH